jgi:hypothetical protein
VNRFHSVDSVDRSHSWLRIGYNVGCYERDNGPSGYIKGGEFLSLDERLTAFQKKCCAPWDYEPKISNVTCHPDIRYECTF